MLFMDVNFVVSGWLSYLFLHRRPQVPSSMLHLVGSGIPAKIASLPLTFDNLVYLDESIQI